MSILLYFFVLIFLINKCSAIQNLNEESNLNKYEPKVYLDENYDNLNISDNENIIKTVTKKENLTKNNLNLLDYLLNDTNYYTDKIYPLVIKNIERKPIEKLINSETIPQKRFGSKIIEVNDKNYLTYDKKNISNYDLTESIKDDKNDKFDLYFINEPKNNLLIDKGLYIKPDNYELEKNETKLNYTNLNISNENQVEDKNPLLMHHFSLPLRSTLNKSFPKLYRKLNDFNRNSIQNVQQFFRSDINDLSRNIQINDKLESINAQSIKNYDKILQNLPMVKTRIEYVREIPTNFIRIRSNNSKQQKNEKLIKNNIETTELIEDILKYENNDKEDLKNMIQEKSDDEDEFNIVLIPADLLYQNENEDNYDLNYDLNSALNFDNVVEITEKYLNK